MKSLRKSVIYSIYMIMNDNARRFELHKTTNRYNFLYIAFTICSHILAVSRHNKISFFLQLFHLSILADSYIYWPFHLWWFYRFPLLLRKWLCISNHSNGYSTKCLSHQKPYKSAFQLHKHGGNIPSCG